MKTTTVTKREGEFLGLVDWDYDFASHFTGYGNPEIAARFCEEAVKMLRLLSAGGSWQATTDGGWPRVGWREVISVGMYDGWPYWRPVPSVCLSGVFGSEWHSFSSLTGVEPIIASKL